MLLRQLSNAAATPRRFWRWAIFLVVVVLAAIQYKQFASLSTDYDPVEWHHDTPVPQGLLQAEEEYHADSVRPEIGTGKGSRILVTGGAGAIGKQLVSRLLSANTPVTVLDIAKHPDELESIKSQFPKGDLEYVQGDIRDPAALKRAIRTGVRGTVHLAGYSRVLYCEENPEDCEDVNVRGTKALLHALPGGWVVLASSSQVYGNAAEFPVKEDQSVDAVNAYGKSMGEAEELVREYAFDGDTNAVILRLSTVYGSASDHQEDFVVDAMEKALAHRPIQVVGNPETDLLHIQDAVNAITLAINRVDKRVHEDDHAGDVETFNIGTPISIKALDFVRKIMWLTNSSSPLQTLPAEEHVPSQYAADVSRAKAVLGFEAKVAIDEGLHRLAMVHLSDTVEFLKRKEVHVCAPRQSYGLNDLLKLDGCSGALAADVEGQPFYAFWDAEQPEDINNGRKYAPEQYGWRDENAPQIWDFHVARRGKFATLVLKRFIAPKKDRQGNITDPGKWIQFEGSSMAEPFIMEVDPASGYVSLSVDSGAPIAPFNLKPPSGRRNEMPDPSKTTLGEFRFRITPFCCPNRASPLPFFRDDPLASNVLDYKLETTRVFNASQIDVLCTRVRDAHAHAASRLEHLKSDTAYKLELAPMPTGRPADWRNKKRKVCTNLCDHPTICLDTGDCACGQPACETKARFPFGAYANREALSYPGEVVSNVEANSTMSLVDHVQAGSWLNVLHPYARRYFRSNPDFHSVHVTAIPDEDEKERKQNPDKFNRLQTEWHGCFSADSVMARTADMISSDFSPNSLVFLPYYSYTQRFRPLTIWAENMFKNLPNVDVANVIMPFTFDFGKCNTVLNGVYSVRKESFVNSLLERASAWQPLGDLNNQCYDVDQDVVIPARTCRQEDLRTMFGNIGSVKPARYRTTLVFFKGAPNGAGTSLRAKIACERPYADIHDKLAGGNELQRYWNMYHPDTTGLPDADAYIATIGDTIFCPVPRGTAGWSPRITDTIYAGCIPVLVGDQTHEPFWDMLNWSKFSVQINDYDVEHLEQILLSIPWDRVAYLQRNLMLIRQMFLYPVEPDMDYEGHGPFFMAMHTASLRKLTAFPV